MKSDRTWRWALGVLVAVAALTAFAPAVSNGFVDFDDNIFIADNPWIGGLGWANIRWMLTAVRGGLWHPLVWLSFAVDRRIWSLEPSGFHFTNIVLHAAAAVLFYRASLILFRRAGAFDAAAGAALAALFFAVHPLRVESVAWAAERKDVLSGAFWLAALLCRLKFVETGRRSWNAAGLAAFGLSLASKATGLMLSPALVILEIYPLRRLPFDPRRWLDRPLRPLWSSLAPYFLLSAAAAPTAVVAANLSGAMQDAAARGIAWRAGQAAFRLLFYPAKTLWPAALSPFYPPKAWFGTWCWELFACAAASAATAAGVWRLRRRYPAAAAALACYAVLLIPMLGLLQSGQAVSACDRYSYLPCLGFAALFGAAFSGRGRAAKGLAAAWLVALGLATWRQCGAWRDSVALWSSAVASGPGEVSLSNLGGALAAEGRASEAVAILERGIASYPRYPLNYEKLGFALQSLDDRSGALAVWRRGLANCPTPELQAYLGILLARRSGRELQQGIMLLRAAVLQIPSAAPWRAELGQAYARAGDARAAEWEYSAAVSLDPLLGRTWNDWGLALARRGKTGNAALCYRAALCDFRTRAQAQYNLGKLLLGQGRRLDAERHFREAARIDPSQAGARASRT